MAVADLRLRRLQPWYGAEHGLFKLQGCWSASRELEGANRGSCSRKFKGTVGFDKRVPLKGGKRVPSRLPFRGSALSGLYIRGPVEGALYSFVRRVYKGLSFVGFCRRQSSVRKVYSRSPKVGIPIASIL